MRTSPGSRAAQRAAAASCCMRHDRYADPSGCSRKSRRARHDGASWRVHHGHTMATRTTPRQRNLRRREPWRPSRYRRSQAPKRHDRDGECECREHQQPAGNEAGKPGEGESATDLRVVRSCLSQPRGHGGAAQEHGQHECDQGEPVGRVGDQKGEGANQSGWPGEMTGRNGA